LEVPSATDTQLTETNEAGMSTKTNKSFLFKLSRHIRCLAYVASLFWAVSLSSVPVQVTFK